MPLALEDRRHLPCRRASWASIGAPKAGAGLAGGRDSQEALVWGEQGSSLKGLARRERGAWGGAAEGRGQGRGWSPAAQSQPLLAQRPEWIDLGLEGGGVSGRPGRCPDEERGCSQLTAPPCEPHAPCTAWGGQGGGPGGLGEVGQVLTFCASPPPPGPMCDLLWSDPQPQVSFRGPRPGGGAGAGGGQAP